MQWNRTSGPFEIRITAVKGQARAGTVSSQFLSDAAEVKDAAPAKARAGPQAFVDFGDHRRGRGGGRGGSRIRQRDCGDARRECRDAFADRRTDHQFGAPMKLFLFLLLSASAWAQIERPSTRRHAG